MMDYLWFIAFIIMVFFYRRERRERLYAEQRAGDAEDRGELLGVMLGNILKENTDTAQSYFNDLIEKDWDEDE